MATSLITSYGTLRLGGQQVGITSGRLSINGAVVMMASDSGSSSVSAAQLASTGQQAWTAAQTNAVNLSGALVVTGGLLGGRIDTVTTSVNTVTTNLASTGSTLATSIGTQSGYMIAYGAATFLAKGSSQSFVTLLTSGTDVYSIPFPTGFASKPRINATLEVTSLYTYGMNVALVGPTGFYAYMSDTIAETGVYIHTEARL